MSFKKFYLQERYISSIKLNNIVYPIYKDINSGEIEDVLKEDGCDGVRFGVENPSVIYGWNINLLHSWVSKSLHTKFWLNLDYVKGSVYLSLSEYSNVELFKNNFGGILATKFKDILPSKVNSVKDIDNNIVWSWTD